MTDKNNVAGIPFGGGKAVIFKQGVKSQNLLKSFASFLNCLNGTYISAEDIGITLEDIIFIREHSEHVFDNVDQVHLQQKACFTQLSKQYKHISLRTFWAKELQYRELAV